MTPRNVSSSASGPSTAMVRNVFRPVEVRTDISALYAAIHASGRRDSARTVRTYSTMPAETQKPAVQPEQRRRYTASDSGVWRILNHSSSPAAMKKSASSVAVSAPVQDALGIEAAGTQRGAGDGDGGVDRAGQQLHSQKEQHVQRGFPQRGQHASGGIGVSVFHTVSFLTDQVRVRSGSV